MSERSTDLTLTAVEDFRSARFHAAFEQIRSTLTGRSADLLSYEEVREKIRAKETNQRDLQTIPLDAIVGSVGRYKDFTRHFFPLIEEDEYRWARVHTLTGSMEGLPPIEVYQIGEAYFVRDGNHRVSVARELGSTHIEAYVTQVETPVPLEPGIQPDDLISKERYAGFLDRTRLKDAYPYLDMSMSVPGNYRVLEQQIGVHQHWVKQNKSEDITYTEAAERWYKWVYWPVIQLIRERGILRDFPGRTETDLYVWIDKHRHELAEDLGWTVDVNSAATSFVETQSARPQRVLSRVGAMLFDAVTPDALEAGPPPGFWRESLQASSEATRLFPRVLVALNGQDDGWLALEQAIQVAQLEQGHLYGLHVVTDKADEISEDTKDIEARFSNRCAEAGVPADFRVETGRVTRTICDRARWTDLVVVSLAHPPGPQPVERLNSQFRRLLLRCPRPVMAVPRVHAGLERILLAYDGSPRADEALYVAAYMAGQWDSLLFVVTVAEDRSAAADIAAGAKTYLDEHTVQSTIVHESGDASEVIMRSAKTHEIDLILMGGYGRNPLLEVVVGSTVDDILRTRNRPVLVCR